MKCQNDLFNFKFCLACRTLLVKPDICRCIFIDSNDRLISERSPISVDFDKMSIIAHGRYSDQSNQSGGGFVVDVGYIYISVH